MLDFLFLFILSAIPMEEIEVPEAPVEIQEEIEDNIQETQEDNIQETQEDSIPLNTKSNMTDEKLLQGGPVKDDETIAVVHTNQGDIVLRFFPEAAPKTVENFVGLAKKDYYDGIIFHRIIDGFMLQGGDPTGTGMGGESLWGGKFEDEFSDTAKNNRGSISMANAGPATNGSQFFINTVNNNFLDNRHTVFGEVISGMNIVDAISKVKTNGADKPLEDVVMNDIEIMTFAEFTQK